MKLNLKVLVIDCPVLSEAVTATKKVCFNGAINLKVLVIGMKKSQDGRGIPFESCA